MANLDAERRKKATGILSEMARRRIESLRLYEPLPLQQVFHKSTAYERVVRGSNRSGKTLSAAVEISRAVLGLDPFRKYPLQDGRCIIVGKDNRHIGEVIYRKLFRAGAFRIIRDEETKLWRAYRPSEKGDKERFAESKPAPPLIPPRFIVERSWESKVESIPNKFVLKNGWEIIFRSSLGSPPNGIDVDLVWFDEEIVVTDWYPEMAGRLLDRSGRFIWSATPQTGTENLLELSERAQKEQMKPLAPGKCRKVEEVNLLLADNPHISEEQKEAFSEKLSKQERAVRIGGEFAINAIRVYSEYRETIHVIEPFPIPNTWTRYAAIDPGRQVAATLFAAVPEPEHRVYGGCVIIYDELYIENCNALVFGSEFAPKVKGLPFEEFLIDNQAARIHEMASGRTVCEQYEEQLRFYGVSSNAFGARFSPANPSKTAGIEAFKSLLDAKTRGRPAVFIFSCCEMFRHELKFYSNKRRGTSVTDTPVDVGYHLVDCARYLALRGCPWKEPKRQPSQPKGSYAMYLRKKKAKEAANGGKQGIILG
ncbi:MAG: hypothetical protein HC888_00535 [Candidatus Competibacteraceae bacterium]|nr:hypothetical protein [Candidatus Competibacteraceae bacterium]